ncbi:MAG TPA: PRC-barrel domain-containing protein [Puia sp.]|nr:PRC-barrel domain-containing protein [Puia sp.]
MSTLEQDNQTGANHGPLFPNLPLTYLAASTVVGEKVRNKEGEHLGTIKDIMLDIRSGKIDYYVIEFGGFLGVGVKYFAIPFRLLNIDTKSKVYIFNQSKETLEKAPGFDQDHWPDTNLHFDEVHSYWSFM